MPMPRLRTRSRSVIQVLLVAALAPATAQMVLDGLPGGPLPGITAREFELFRIGQEEFTEIDTPADGLGPTFNANACAACHNIPAIGGSGTITELRAGYRDENGQFRATGGGTLYHLFSIPPHNCQPRIPEEANVFARRISIPLFGAGLVEAIPDETILGLEDPDDRDGDGIRGRASRIIDMGTRRPRIGRFGWKAQQAALLTFAADAYLNEMGITNDIFPDETAAGVEAETLRRCDTVADPEDERDRRTGLRGIDKFELFMKFLAPPARGPIGAAASRGEQIFSEIGCAKCHAPELRTGPSANPVFDRKPVPLFSDLLLHDIGTGDGIEQASARGEEIKTPPLWGLRLRRPLLHDGSAATPDAAIRRHEGEALRVRDRFLALDPIDREALLAFLKSL
jgi:CxxC motif-containing protein (DUF1111 family)